jgi:hypothetical protein
MKDGRKDDEGRKEDEGRRERRKKGTCFANLSSRGTAGFMP